MNEQAKRLYEHLRLVDMAKEAGCLHEPDIQAKLDMSLTRLRRGELRVRFDRPLENTLLRRLVAAATIGERAPVFPQYPPDIAFPIAQIVGTDQMLWRPLDLWCEHTFLQGTTGSGKTTAQVTLMDGFYDRGIQIIVIARKEAGRIFLRYPDAILLRPQQLFINFADSVGDPRLFYAEWIPILARGIGIHSDYIPKFLEVVIRAHASEAAKGRKLSLVRLERIFRALGKRGDRRCATIAGALAAFNLFLGETARVETAPAWESDSRVIVLDREGAPPAYRACLDGMLLHRFQAKAALEGYTSHLRRVIFYDEVGLDFNRDFESQQASSGFVTTGKRLNSQSRSYGVAIIYSGQSYSQASDDIKDNTNTFILFRTPSPDQIREVALRMNLSEPWQRLVPGFPSGHALFVGPDLPNAVELQFLMVDLGPYPAEDVIAAKMEPVLQDLRNRSSFTTEESIQPLDVAELLGEESTTPTPAAPTCTTASDPSAVRALLADHWALLRDVIQHPDCGIAARFHRLGFGGSRGNRIKEQLIGLGLLEAVEIRKSPVGAATKLLRLTSLARTLPGL